MVISVGIDVSKDKHDCFIVNSEGEVLTDVFTIQNTRDGFNFLLQKIQDCTTPQDKIKVGLEATGHYSYLSLIHISLMRSAKVSRMSCLRILSGMLGWTKGTIVR